MGNQHNSLEFDSTEQMFRNVQQIEKNENIMSFLLENVDWVTELRLSHNDVDLSSELFLKKVEKLINYWAPLQIVSNKQKKLLHKPWLTSSILKPIEIKNRLHKRMCPAKDPLHKEELANKIKNYKNILKLTRKSKANHFNKYFHDNKLNIFKTWEGIREIINISKKGSNNINSIQIGKNTLTNSSDIANEFNRYLTSVAKQIEEKLIKTKHPYSKYLENPNSNSFFITPTNNEEVLFEIKNLKNDKSQTPLSKPISLTANLSFSTGIFPTNLKTANVIPIFKKDYHTSCNSYRPISLLSNISNNSFNNSCSFSYY